MDLKKFLKPLAGIALSIAAFASCAVGVKNPVLVDAFEYSTSDPSSRYTFGGAIDGVCFTLVDEVYTRYDFGYLALKSNKPSSIQNLAGKFEDRNTTFAESGLSNPSFKLYTASDLSGTGKPFVSLDVLGSSGGVRDVFSIVSVLNGSMEVLYCSDPESWKTEYGAAMVYQWEVDEDPTFYLIRAKDFLSYKKALDSIVYEASWVAPDEQAYRFYGSWDIYFGEDADQLSLNRDGVVFYEKYEWVYPNVKRTYGGYTSTFDFSAYWTCDSQASDPWLSYNFKLNSSFGANFTFRNLILLTGIDSRSGVDSSWLAWWDSNESYGISLRSLKNRFDGIRFQIWIDPADPSLGGEGYAQGYDDGYNEGYMSGYNDGQSAGQAYGNSSGYGEGYSEGYADGYGNGFHDGDISAQGISWNFFSMLSMVFSAPFTIIVNSFDFTFFEGTPNAFNFGTFFWGMFSLLLAFAIFKVIWGFIAGGK